MTAVASTLTPVSYAKFPIVTSNIKVVYRDWTLDTGDYAAAGITITAASLKLKRINFVSVSGGAATSGTAGATASPLGVTYAAAGTSVAIQLYEAGSSGAPLGEKTAEAVEANFTIRLRIEGI